MLDLSKIVKTPESVKTALVRRGEIDPPIDEILSIDSRRRDTIQILDSKRALRNKVSKLIGDEKRKPTPTEVSEMRAIGEDIKSLELDLDELQKSLNKLLISLPNLPLSDVPDGLNEESNEVVETSNEPEIRPDFIPHWDLASELNILDLKAAASISGARFYVLKGKGARLNRALGAWMLDIHSGEFGYTEIEPPLLVRTETMTGSGNLPKFRDNLYQDSETELWLIPTAEVALNALHQNTIIGPGKLPLKYVAQTPSFRKEHTAAGRDVRGIKRVHQFEKVEMFRFVNPEDSELALEEMIDEAKSLCRKLGLVYRVLKLCSGDIGFQSAKTYDIEVWAPGSQEWLEVSSVSTCTDFQTRRNNTRFRLRKGDPPKFPYTLNGSGLALPRIWIAIIENGQRPDGSVFIPEILQPYTGFKTIDYD